MAKLITFMMVFQWISMVLCLASTCMDTHCQYDLHIRQKRSMTYTSPQGITFNVAWNDTEKSFQIIENVFHKEVDHAIIGDFVSTDDVISTDGNTRNIYVINEQFPGPTIEVMEGAQVTLNVHNLLHTESLTIHVHGLHYKNNVWMDGVGHVTQCPIQPGQSFEYRVTAEPAGTHWYHAHFRNKRIDGIYGAFIVHRRLPQLPYHVVTLQDWFRYDANTLRVMNPYDPVNRGSGEASLYVLDRDYSVDGNELSAMRYDSTLIGGRGRRLDNVTEPLPLATYDVTSGSRYRFRLIHTGAEHTYEVMIDDHQMDIVALDGFEIRSVKVDSFIINPGERIDFEIETNSNSDLYWLRAEIIRQGQGLPIVLDGIVKGGKAILRYNSVMINNDPSSNKRECTATNNCTVFNCPFLGYRKDQYKNCLTLNDVQSISPDVFLEQEYGVNDEQIEEYFLNWGYHIGSSVNARKFAHPTAPYSVDNSNNVIPCDETACEQGCYCTNIQDLPYNKTIQLVISNYQESLYLGHHAMHLHGHSFAILKTGFPDYNSTTGLWETVNDDVICNNNMCTHPSWNGGRPEFNEKSVVRDTFVIPARGYAVLRFKSNNPGYWMFHCHQQSHLEEGMAMLFNEAPGMHPPLPTGFPTCGDFHWNDQNPFDETMDRSGTGSNNNVHTTNTPSNSANIMDSEDSDDITLSSEVLIGGSVGLVLLGAVIATVPMFIYLLCSQRNQPKA